MSDKPVIYMYKYTHNWHAKAAPLMWYTPPQICIIILLIAVTLGGAFADGGDNPVGLQGHMVCVSFFPVNRHIGARYKTEAHEREQVLQSRYIYSESVGCKSDVTLKMIISTIETVQTWLSP